MKRARRDELRARRRAARYTLRYPDSLPITEARPAILEALKTHRVLVVCGATGSGKTTQLPKLCLEAGRGVLGMIGHTQPRRIAAFAVAARLTEELNPEGGGVVGLEVRFTDRCDPAASIKVMTDGILLNEIRRDRWLQTYDTLIIDEAHERSLNIDFILGYLKRIEQQRPDLKVIVTSATIDPERFSRHFGGAPILRVEGRNHPVEVRYRPLESEQELADAVVAAAEELASEVDAPRNARDILVFLPGERWIRDSEQALTRAGPKGYEILPLYARMTTARQRRIFGPGPAPRIVLSTNVAETSLTVPRIGYVIDSGLARVSRYSTRQRLQGLGVEPIARANALQRAGRCGRIAPGVCVRLYSEQDFESRPEFTDPEIQRTSLAGVILRLEAWRLGHIDDFPFIDAPPAKAVSDAYQLLEVLGALDAERRLTADGAAMARLPVDPRVARLLVVANRNGALREALVIAAALSIVDPREHSPEQSETARRQHEKFADPRSDFMTYLNLWRTYRRARRDGERAFRVWCRSHHLSAIRLKEWYDVHGQLRELVLGLGWRSRRKRAHAGPDYKAIHQAVLAAFVDFIAEHEQDATYRGMRDLKAALFPGSALARKRPRWLVAAERVATERPYLRTAAQINPRWAIQMAPHLIKRTYLEPAWDPERGVVTAREIVTLFGLTLASDRRVDYGTVDPAEARKLFIRDGLAADRLDLTRHPLPLEFLERNRRLRAEVLAAEARLRRRDLFIGEPGLAAFYAARLPPAVRDRASLIRECAGAAEQARLTMTLTDVASRAVEVDRDLYPDHVTIAGQCLPLAYHFEPGAEEDGLTLTLPLELLGAVRAERLDWLIPGWLPDKILALLRSLPKDLRRSLVPLPDTCAALLPSLANRVGQQALLDAIAAALLGTRGASVPRDAFDERELAPHFAIRIVVVGPDGAEIARGRDLGALQRTHLRGVDPKIGAVSSAHLQRSGLTHWDCGDLPDSVAVRQRPRDLQLYPTLVDRDGGVDLILSPPGADATERHRRGVRRLLLKCLPQQVAMIREQTLGERALVLSYHGVGSSEDLVDDLLCASADESFDLAEPIRTRAAFDACLDRGRGDLVPAATRLRALLSDVLTKYREIRSTLDALPAVHASARADMLAQLERLIGPRCLTDTPPEWRRHLPRYLKAIEQRREKLAQRGPKDAELEADVRTATERLERWRATLPAGWPWPEPMVRYRWLLEELRVSLFAQSLRTSSPVSAKRLEEHWRRALAEQSAAA